MYIDKSRTVPRWDDGILPDESSRQFWDSVLPAVLPCGWLLSAAGNGISYDLNQDIYCEGQARAWYDYWTERPTTPTANQSLCESKRRRL